MCHSVRYRVVLVALVVCLLGSAPGAVLAGGDKGSKEKLQELLKKRLEAATTAFKFSSERFKKGGVGSPIEVLPALKALTQARLELCQTKAERFKAYEQTLQEAEFLAQMAEKLAQAGQGSLVDGALLRVYVLEIQIALEKTKLGM